MEDYLNAALKFVEDLFNRGVDRIIQALNKPSEKEVIEVKPDFTPLLAKLEGLKAQPLDIQPLIEAIRASEKGEAPEIDLSSLTTQLRAIAKNTKEKVDLAPLLEAVKGVSVVVPSTFQLHPDQVRALRNPKMPSASRVTVANVTMTSANTEYSYTFPANTLSWRMKLRANNATFYYSWTTGTLPTAGDGSSYITIPQNFLDSRAGVEFSGKTIYFSSPTASQTMEIESNLI